MLMPVFAVYQEFIISESVYFQWMTQSGLLLIHFTLIKKFVTVYLYYVITQNEIN